MTESSVTNISLSNYTWQDRPDGSVTINFEGGVIALKLNPEDVERLMAAAYEIVERRRGQMVEAVQNVQLPPLLGYDSEKTIEAELPAPPNLDDEIPF